MAFNPKQTKQREYFLEHFGPEELKKYHGAELLKFIAAPRLTGNKRDSSQYNQQLNELQDLFGKNFIPEDYSSLYQILEEKLKDFGSVNGSQNTTRELFYNQTKSSWQSGKSLISSEDTIKKAENFKENLLIATQYLSNEKFNDFYQYVTKYQNFFDKAFIHKYLYICFPQWVLLDYHTKSIIKNFCKDVYSFKKRECGPFALENYFYQKNPGKNFTLLVEDVQKKLHDFISKDISSLVLEFILKSRKAWETRKQTNNVTGSYKNTKIEGKTGQGNSSFCSFLAALGYEQETRQGIYPVMLFDKETEKLEVCYGVSKTNPPSVNWPPEKLRNLNNSSTMYSASKVLKVFDIPQDEEKINEILPDIINAFDTIIEDFHKVFQTSQETHDNATTNLTNFPLNQILFGPPGTGKTYHTIIKAMEIINEKEYSEEEKKKNYQNIKGEFDIRRMKGQIKFITFHQNYSYEDFVGGIRPVLDGKKVAYYLYEGPFKEIAEQARQDENNNYVLIIDEINRGNISKIFGELITLIEEDKRDGNKHKLSIPLMYHKKGEAEFSVPANLYIIGTMNTADKSIAFVDFALRRRFTFEEMMPNPELLDDTAFKKDGFSLKEWFRQTNEIIKKELDKDHQIGHSYFIPKERGKGIDLPYILDKCIIPLLQEYCYGEPDKLQKILPNFFDENGLLKIKPNQFMDALVQKKENALSN